MQGEILDGLQLVSQYLPCCMDLNWTHQCQKSMKQRWHMLQNLKWMLLPQYYPLTGLLCLKCVFKPCTQMNEPAKRIPSRTQWNGLCRTNLICGFVQTMQGIEKIYHALELGDEEEQHRGEWGLCEAPKIWWLLVGSSKTWPSRISLHKGRIICNY